MYIYIIGKQYIYIMHYVLSIIYIYCLFSYNVTINVNICIHLVCGTSPVYDFYCSNLQTLSNSKFKCVCVCMCLWNVNIVQ